MKKLIFIIFGLFAFAGCADSGFTVNTLVSPATEKIENPNEYYKNGFALTDQISQYAVDNLMGMP